jgi:hypothetical protein
MAERTITSANSTFMLTIPGPFPVPVKIQGYAVEAMFDFDMVDVAETRMGADGILSAAYTPKEKTMHIHLQPDSDSVQVFLAWAAYEEAKRDKVAASAGVIIIPSTGKIVTFTKGFLRSAKLVADHKKAQDPLDFVIAWEKVVTAGL